MVPRFNLPSTEASLLPRHAERKRRTISLLSILACLFATMLLLGVAGCGGPAPTVADNVDQAFKDGQAKDKVAQDDQDKNRKDDATKAWKEAADYYGAVAGKYTGKNHIEALLTEAQDLQKMTDSQTSAEDVRDYSAALQVLRTARQDSATDPALHTEVQAAYDDLVTRMDLENKKTKQYFVMDSLVRLLGGNSESSPILAILCISVTVLLVTWPLRVKQARTARELARYQPELKKLQDKYKAEPQELWAKTQEFNKKHGINQFAGCLPAVLQLPIVFIMYRLILSYQFHFRNTTFLWINPNVATAIGHLGLPFTLTAPNLGEQDLILLLLYAVSMYVQTRLTPVTSSDPQVVEQQKMMATFMPAIFFITMLRYNLPSAFVLYWFSSNVLTVGQQWWINRNMPKLPPLVLESDDDDNSDSGPGKPLKANPKLISPTNRQQKKK